MNNLFDRSAADAMKARLQRLRPDSQRQWGSMTATQAVAHLARGFELAFGERRPPRVFMGRIFGRVIKKLALGDDAPMRKNSPTVPGMVMADDHDFAAERARLEAMIDRFVAAGPAGCTDHPHSFFGRLTADEWAVLM